MPLPLRAKARERRWREPDTPDGRWILERQGGRGVVVFACLFVAIVTGGIAFSFILGAQTTWVYVLAVLFAVVPLACLAAAGHQLLSVIGPQVVLEVDHLHAPLGGSMTAHWRLQGGRRSLREVVFVLVGKERRTLLESDGHRRSESIFYAAEIARVPTGARSGVVEISIPAGTMHSFASDHHEIEWSILMTADIDWWPDDAAAFKITVSPEAG